jgi:thermopsin
MVAAAHSSTTTPLPYQLILLSGYYQPYQIDAPSTPTSIYIQVSSNTTLSTAIMTNSQYNNFNNGGAISASLFLQNSSTVTHTLKVSEGLYYLVFFTYGFSANVTYNIQTFPISPYYSYPLTPPEPTGVAAFGLNNVSGVVTPYTIKSTDVVGIADIASMQAYNASASFYNDTLSGATLQLNSVLVVNELGGNQQVYWTQDTPDFVTASSVVSWADNIWNGSVSGFLSNSTVTSTDGGYTYPANPGYYYSFQSSNSSYVFPFMLALLMSETTIPGTGVQVQIGAQVMGNGSEKAQAIDWFDNATIHDPSVQSAYFLVSGNATAPDGLFYESELVFGGEGNGEATGFTALSSALGLFYGNSTTGVQTAYPTEYTFGGNTGEAADNLKVTYTGNGISAVSLGIPDYVYLGGTTGTYSLPVAGTTVTTVLGSNSTQASTTSQTGSSGAASSFPASFLGTVFVLLAVVVLATVSASHSRQRTSSAQRGTV